MECAGCNKCATCCANVPLCFGNDSRVALVISGATQIPFLLVLFGVLGGLAAFGMVGLFIGPVILAVLMAIWREWIAEKRSQADPT